MFLQVLAIGQSKRAKRVRSRHLISGFFKSFLLRVSGGKASLNTPYISGGEIARSKRLGINEPDCKDTQLNTKGL